MAVIPREKYFRWSIRSATKLARAIEAKATPKAGRTPKWTIRRGAAAVMKPPPSIGS